MGMRCPGSLLAAKLEILNFCPALPVLVRLPQLMSGVSMKRIIWEAWFCFLPCLAMLKNQHQHYQHDQTAGGISPPQQHSWGFTESGLLKFLLSLLHPALVLSKACQSFFHPAAMIRIAKVKNLWAENQLVKPIHIFS